MTESSPVKKAPTKRRSHSSRIPRSGKVIKKFLLVFIFLVAQLMFFYSDFFKLKEIQVFGNNRVSAEEIIKTANIPVDRNIVTLPLNESKKRLDVIYWLKDTKIRWSVPGKVAIYVEERTPAILVRNTANPSKWFVSDEHGMILYEAKANEKKHFPRMAIEEDIVIGKIVNPDRIRTLNDIDAQLSEELKKKLLYYFIDERLEITIFFQENDKVYKIKFGKARDINRKLKTLDAILDLVKEKGVDVEYIDVRFREPILKPVEDGKKNKPADDKKEE